jgi:predicted metal-dependent hydrolase
MSMTEFQKGVALFDQGRFYDAHEVLEDVWRAAQGEEKRFLQGLIQAAVALHHHSTGNTRGACSLLARAVKNLAADPGPFGNIARTQLVECLCEWQQALQNGGSPPSLPSLEIPRC